MKIGMNYTQSLMQNQLRTHAHFVAMNAAAELQIAGKWITGTETLERDEQGQKWKIQQTAHETMSPNVQRIEIQVLHFDPETEQTQGVTTLTLFNQRQMSSTP